MFPQLHTLLPVRQEVCDSPAGGIGLVELGEPDLKQSWEDRIKGRAEIHKQDSGICSWGVQMLEGVDRLWLSGGAAQGAQMTS